MIAVPYHLGQRGVAVGRGPLKILEALGKDASKKWLAVEGANDAADELDAVADVNAQLAKAVAVHEGRAIVLAGNCNSCIGTLTGILDQYTNIGVVWLDAHGDFNTPETTLSGALDGMSLAIAAGHCHTSMMQQPVREQNIILAATRSLDPLEKERLDQSAVSIVRIADLAEATATLADRVDTIYLHIDLDVLDPSVSPGVNFSEAGGIGVDQLFDAVRLVDGTGKLGAAAIANFNPDRDVEDKTLKIATRLVGILSEFK